MKLEDQVVSLELAKKLKELGVKQESFFWWCGLKDRTGKNTWSSVARYSVYSQKLVNSNEVYAAFTVAELGEMLPSYLIPMVGIESEMRFDLNIWKDAGWHIAYWWDEDTRRLSDMKIETFVEATEADARGKMLTYLIENELIPFP